MAKMRGIKPEFWTDDKVVALTPLARLLFLGMWNFACDNGHLDDSALQLKMRILPADNVDISELLNEHIGAGIVERQDGYLTVVKLSQHQRIDTRYLTLCDHCETDVRARFSADDKRPRSKQAAGDTEGARRAHDVHTTSARAEGRKEGEEKKEASQPRPEVDALCQHLADRIEANGAKRPSIGKTWRDEARRLLDVDKRPLGEAQRLINWSQDSAFWKANILSMPKFREKYDQLKLQAGMGTQTQADPWAHVKTVDQLRSERDAGVA